MNEMYKLEMERADDSVLEWETKRKGNACYVKILRLVIAEDQRKLDKATEKLSKNPTETEREELEHEIKLMTELLPLQKERFRCEEVLYSLNKRGADREMTRKKREIVETTDSILHIEKYRRIGVEFGREMGFEKEDKEVTT